MKGLYITTYDANNAYSGVCKKITSQVGVFEHYGISMSLVDAGSIKKVSSSPLLDQLSSLFGRNNKPVWEQLFDVSNNLLLKDDYEFIYIRKKTFHRKLILVCNFQKHLNSVFSMKK